MTLWTLLLVAVLLTALGVVVEVSHLFLARVELENALEGAALAAVKEWAEHSSAPTLGPRLMGVEYASANTVSGTPVTITTNYNASNSPNQNDSCQGNLIFGAVSLNPPFTFNAGVAPQCEQVVNYGTVGLTFQIKTSPGGTTFREADGFALAFLNQPHPPAGVYITKVTYELQATAADNGEFDVDTTPTAPATEDLANGPLREGWGPVFHPGASSGIAVPPTFSPDGSVPGQSSKLEIAFAANDFGPGDVVVFGVDTDKVGSGLGDSNDTADDGGDFKDAGEAFTLTIEFNNGAKVVISATDPEVQQAAGKTFTPAGLTKDLIVIIPSTGEFGVRAQATVPVQPVFSSLLCLPIGPFSVSARATARSGCTSTRPQLIRVENFICP